jgi:hypothetical protein
MELFEVAAASAVMKVTRKKTAPGFKNPVITDSDLIMIAVKKS